MPKLTRSWVRRLFRRSAPATPRQARPPVRLALEALEDRWVPSTIVVNNPTDTPVAGETDLRQAIAQANTAGGDQTITFDKTVFKTAQTINLTGSQLELSDTTGTETITGPAAGVTISGDNASGVFTINSGANASFSGLTITGGNDGNGGGILDGGTLSLTDCTVTGNAAPSGVGGGISNSPSRSSQYSSLSEATLRPTTDW